MTAIHGVEVEISEIDPGESVTDIIILTRTVGFDDNGRPFDDLYVSGTPLTTGIIHAGMLHAALDGMQMGVYSDEDGE